MNNYTSSKKTKNNLWILTEERPKIEVLEQIIAQFAKDKKFSFLCGKLQIIPLLNKKLDFTFTYKLVGVECINIDNIIIKIVSGASSFVDFLIFYQENIPNKNDIPLYAIEETKTSDLESRNTGVYQRSSKFVYVDQFYPSAKKIMLYNHKENSEKKPTDTNIFGTRLLLTLGVTFLGKTLTNEFKPFENIQEVIEYKNAMRPAPAGNVPINISQNKDTIYISGRLVKSDSLAHDPNIGALSAISATLRKLGWQKNIVITSHELEQKHLSSRNKFCKIAKNLNLEIESLICPQIKKTDTYWHYELKSEKLATIFIHIAIENFTHGYSIFENHAGCEKAYFIKSDGTKVALAKYANKNEYKNGDKSAIISIPDIIFVDTAEEEIITVEGKQYQNKAQGIKELNAFDSIENIYITPSYPDYKLIRTVVLYGSLNNEIVEVGVSFLLNSQGKIILGINAPKLFETAIENLNDFWK